MKENKNFSKNEEKNENFQPKNQKNENFNNKKSKDASAAQTTASLTYEPSQVQNDILNSVEKNQLVSAGAGSGKTTVMIKKIANLIVNEKIDVNSLLVVTFTVLAQEEMKSRLVSRIKDEILNSHSEEEKLRLTEVKENIKTASIDTIDGFSSKMIKKYFYELNISPNIEIMSDSAKDYYITRAMKMTMDEFSNQPEKIYVLLDIFSGNSRDLKNLEKSILQTYYDVINIENYEEFLVNSQKEYQNSSKSEKIVNNLIKNKINEIKFAFNDFVFPSDDGVRAILNQDLNILSSFDEKGDLKSRLGWLKFSRLFNFSKFSRKYESLKDINAVISAFNTWVDKLQKDGIDENFEQKNQKTSEYFNYFVEILLIFIKNYQKLKEKNNFIDFNDLNRLMLKLLDKEAVRNELRSQYRYIFVDEYQDVNPLQDSLIKKIAGEDSFLFAVGDVKQSIYGFRGASPEWFLSQYDGLKSAEIEGRAFDMNENYRSNPLILNFINEVFSSIMDKKSADIDYKNDAMIQPRRTDIVDEKVKILAVKKLKEPEPNLAEIYSVKADTSTSTKPSKQAMIVLNEITRLVGTTFYDANLKEERPMRYKDIAILVRSEKSEECKSLVKLLKDHAIPLSTNNKLELDKSEGVKLIISILKCVVGSADDVDYLATFLALTDMSMDDLVCIRNKDETLLANLMANRSDEKISLGFATLAKIRSESFVSTNSELIRKILYKYKLRYYILRQDMGASELQIVEEFISKISPLDDSLNLSEFIEVTESNVSKGSDYTTIDLEDSVTIQTIHKSKGLEYPVVFLFDASRQFPFVLDNDVVNFNSEIGLGIDFYDLTSRTKTYTVCKYAIKNNNYIKGYKEEIRLLYVALTRAKNKLYIIGELEEDFEEKPLGKTNFLNVVMSCFQGRVHMGRAEDANFEFVLLDDVVLTETDADSDTRQAQRIKEGFIYAHQDIFAIPLKNSVTGITSAHSQQSGFKTKEHLTPAVQYQANEDRALIGTHYHSALESLDFNAPYEKSTDFADVDYAQIEQAHKALSALVKGSLGHRKEAEFMLYVPYREIVPDSDIEEKILVQGVVDLLIEFEHEIVLVDYKFSLLPAKVLKEKYTEQLRLYKLAIEKAYQKPVNKMYIYSINSGELV